jgi:protein-tyrosine phosphatase
MNQIKKVLFICFGNTCRSPAAEYLAKWMQHTKYKDKLNGVIFDSAGFDNYFTYAQPETVSYIKSKGGDISDFHPKIFNKKLIEEQDLVITMEEHQVESIIKTFSNITDIERTTSALKQFVGETRDIDIDDPYMQGHDYYIEIMKTIEENVEKLIQKIILINKGC